MSKKKIPANRASLSSRFNIDDDDSGKEEDKRIDSIVKQMRAQIKKQLDAFNKVSESQAFLSNQFEDLQAEIKNIRKDNKKMKADIEHLKREKIDLDKRVQQLEQCITKSKQDNNSNCMIITNVPKIGADVDLRKVVVKISEQVEQPITNDAILNIYQVSSTKRNTFPIVVKMKNDELKRKCIEFRKLGNKINFENIIPSLHNNGKNINFHQLMEKEYSVLLSSAKKQAKEKGYKYVWFTNGTVLVRKTEEGPIIKIKDQNDISKIK